MENLLVAELPALRAEEQREVIASAAAAVPAQVRGQVRVDGAVWSSGEAGLQQANVADGRDFTLSLDPRGGFKGVVRAGTYLPYIEWQDGEQSKRLWADARLTLIAGEQQCALSFERRSLSFEVQTAAGQAASGIPLRVIAIDFPEVDPMTTAPTDANGRVQLDPTPPGRLQIAWRCDNQWADLGSAVGSPSPVRLRLPR
ncbi:MAG: hypothetical protein FJ306_02995 [Planctomycetes bacterium]|nr:hypothetical protein [Planctomycetota bacterium]